MVMPALKALLKSARPGSVRIHEKSTERHTVSDTKRRVLETQTPEVEAWNGAIVANTLLPFPAMRNDQHKSVNCQRMTYPTPVVKLTFSSSVICSTKVLALAYAAAQSPEPSPAGEG